MKIAIPNGGTYDGVKLYTNRSTPFPENAIHPVNNFTALLAIPEQYRIVDDGVIREMTQDEKDVVDQANIENLRALTVSQVEVKNQELAAAGFSFGGKVFSLAPFDTSIWIGMEVGNILSGLTFPQGIETADRESYSIPDAATLHAFYAAGMTRWKEIFDGAGTLKNTVQAAESISVIRQAIDDNNART